MSRSLESYLLPVFVAVGLVLSGCTTTPPPRPTYPEIRFTHLPPIELDVGEIVIVDRYTPPLKAPNVEHRFPVQPAAVAYRWAQDRLRAVGRFGTARVSIEEASVVSEKLRTKKGLTGAFTREQAERLVGVLRMRVEVGGDGALGRGFAEGNATARRTVPEDISLNRRDQIYYEFTGDLMEKMNGVMEESIRQHLHLLVR